MVGSEKLSNRLLNIYLPLVFYLLFLLFPFYWMTHRLAQADQRLVRDEV